MAGAYNDAMWPRQTLHDVLRPKGARNRAQAPALPRLWLISDARNDGALEQSLNRLPRGSGFIYRHYHLPDQARRARFYMLARICARRSITIILAGPPELARRWRAAGHYGAAGGIQGKRRSEHIWLATVHSLRDIAAANRLRADGLLLSPVFPTRSHPDARPLGSVRFRLMARHAQAPVIALGGMDFAHARRLGWGHWAAIDGLSCRDS